MGAALSCALFCMLPAVRCNIRRLQNQFAFHPPYPTYSLTPDGGALTWASGVQPPSSLPGISIQTTFVTSARGNRVAIFHYVRQGAQLTLLWSHGNAMDCGECVELLQLMAHRLNVNVIAYDYAGYGASSGSPTEAGTYADIEAVHNYANGCGVHEGSLYLPQISHPLPLPIPVSCAPIRSKSRCGVPDEKLVICGQSVGSGPSLWLTERHPALRGLFLMSALTSGLRVLSPAPFCSKAGFCGPPYAFICCDIFPNHRRLPKVRDRPSARTPSTSQ